MNEQDWLSSTDPQVMLDYLFEGSQRLLGRTVAHPVSDRRLRLWAVACCRRAWHLLTDERGRHAVEVAERHADGMAPDQELATACSLTVGIGPGVARSTQRSLAAGVSLASAHLAARCLLADADTADHCRAQANLLREVVGNPWRPFALAPSLLTPTVLGLARAAYDEPGPACVLCKGKRVIRRTKQRGREFSGFETFVAEEPCPDCNSTGRVEDGTLDPVRLMVLADALEEAGCPTELDGPCPDCSAYHQDASNPFGVGPGYRPERDLASGRHEGGWTNCKTCNSRGGRAGVVRVANPLLQHLRGPGPHVRGCWALDLVLGKE